MGIVKRKALETKVVQAHQVSRFRVSWGRVVVGMRVHEERENGWAQKGLPKVEDLGSEQTGAQDPKLRARRALIMRVAAYR